MKSTKMSFGFATVNVVRNAGAEPQLIASSTDGGFRITPAVSRALGIAAGDYVMFLSNVDAIDAAIAERNETIVAFCEENGLDIASPEAAAAIHKEFDAWAIAKGIVEYDLKGNKKVTTERLTKKDKLTFVKQNFEAVYKEAMASDDEALREALSREGATQEELIEILAEGVTGKEIDKVRGSKTANTSKQTGVGLALSFTDSNVWHQLKQDLEDKNAINRVFAVDIDDLQEVVMSNGYKDVTVKVATLGAYTDETPIRRGNGDENVD